ncbi:MAG: hypothetical protein CSA24_02150 [Deltaproteobacteria bacterium]|nr:MAG: hypothetical protein CSA24_02150 [Deltaproteobacteria bacterium]
MWGAAGLVGCPGAQRRADGHRGTVVYDKSPSTPPTPKGPPVIQGGAIPGFDDGSTGRVANRPTPHARAAARALAAAEAREAEGDELGARSLYQQVQQTYPESPEAVAARVALAEDALSREDFDVARALVEEVAGQAGPEPFAFRRQAALGRALEGLQSYLEAARAFALALVRAARPQDQADAARGVARNAFRVGELEQAEAAVRAHLAPTGASEAQVRRTLVHEVAGRVSPRVLGQLYRKLPKAEPLLAWVALQHARALCGALELDACAEAATLARDQPRAEVDWRTAAEQLLERVRQWNQVRPRSIGVMLPDSGEYKGIGAAARAAIELALDDVPGLTILWRDTGGEADAAAEIAEQLVLHDHVAAILGPVGQKESAAAAEVTARYGVPHLVLSSAEEVAEAGPSVLRLRLSATDQGRAVARYAAAELAATRVAILFPDNAYGEALMGAFWDEIVRLGGEVWAVEGYAPGTGEFSPTVAALLDASKPGKGDTTFEALFIPDGARTVRRLVPFLKFWGVTVRTEPRPGARAGVQLLGGSGWNHSSVVDRGDNLTDNAVFVDAYVHDPDDPEVDRFTKRFFTRHQRWPRAFHAEVYDATVILARAVAPVDGGDHAVRRAILANLTATRNHAGATGLVSVMDDGTVLRAPRLLTIDLDDIRARLSEEEERELRQQRFKGEGAEDPILP